MMIKTHMLILLNLNKCKKKVKLLCVEIIGSVAKIFLEVKLKNIIIIKKGHYHILEINKFLLIKRYLEKVYNLITKIGPKNTIKLEKNFNIIILIKKYIYLLCFYLL